MKRFILSILIITLLFSCQKENYDLDINNGDPILVVDGRIQNHEKNIIVNLSQSTDLLGDNPQKFINDASVFLKINDLEEIQLEFISDGDYKFDSIEVSAGTQYDLRIVWGEEEYTSSSEMLNEIPVDLFIFEESSFGGEDNEPLYNMNMLLNIDLSTTNYYITESEVILSKDEDIIGDNAYLPWDDGSYATNPAFFPFFVESFPDSTIIDIKFSHIPKDIFDFYESLNDVGSQSPSSVAPANPLSNISNGAIGSFGAFATFDTTIVVFP